MFYTTGVSPTVSLKTALRLSLVVHATRGTAGAVCHFLGVPAVVKATDVMEPVELLDVVKGSGLRMAEREKNGSWRETPEHAAVDQAARAVANGAYALAREAVGLVARDARPKWRAVRALQTAWLRFEWAVDALVRQLAEVGIGDDRDDAEDGK